MPPKYTIKDYQPRSYYHVYNRGAFKKQIFKETKDYWAFRKLVKKTLTNSTRYKNRLFCPTTQPLSLFALPGKTSFGSKFYGISND